MEGWRDEMEAWRDAHILQGMVTACLARKHGMGSMGPWQGRNEWNEWNEWGRVHTCCSDSKHLWEDYLLWHLRSLDRRAPMGEGEGRGLGRRREGETRRLTNTSLRKPRRCEVYPPIKMTVKQSLWAQVPTFQPGVSTFQRGVLT